MVNILHWDTKQKNLVIAFDGLIHSIHAASQKDLPRAIEQHVISQGTIDFEVLLLLSRVKIFPNHIPDMTSIQMAKAINIEWGKHKISGVECHNPSYVDDILHAGPFELSNHIPSDMWLRAQWCVNLGFALWNVRGDVAHNWGYIYITEWPTENNRPLFLGIPLITSLVKDVIKVSLPISNDYTFVGDIWTDWISLAGGPDFPHESLLPHGLGHPSLSPLVTSTGTEGSLSPARAQIFFESAQQLLLKQMLPGPRYINRLLHVDLPYEDVSELTKWRITALRLIPHSKGLWCSFLENKEVIKSVWWSANPSQGEYTPYSIPPAAWLVFHMILSSVWYDLCHETIIIPNDLAALDNPTVKNNNKPKEKAQQTYVIRLPMKRRVVVNQVQWFDEKQRTKIQRTLLLGNSYRRLPTGWQERQHKADFQSVRKRAIERAEKHGAAPPPPGWTFVRPYAKGPDNEEDDKKRENMADPLKSLGLISLLLAFRAKQDSDT